MPNRACYRVWIWEMKLRKYNHMNFAQNHWSNPDGYCLHLPHSSLRSCHHKINTHSRSRCHHNVKKYTRSNYYHHLMKYTFSYHPRYVVKYTHAVTTTITWWNTHSCCRHHHHIIKYAQSHHNHHLMKYPLMELSPSPRNKIHIHVVILQPLHHTNDFIAPYSCCHKQHHAVFNIIRFL